MNAFALIHSCQAQLNLADVDDRSTAQTLLGLEFAFLSDADNGSHVAALVDIALDLGVL